MTFIIILLYLMVEMYVLLKNELLLNDHMFQWHFKALWARALGSPQAINYCDISLFGWYLK